MTPPEPLPRRTAVSVLLVLGCIFASNHIGARTAFDHGTGLLFAMLARTAVSGLALTALVLWRRVPLLPPPGTLPWLLLLGSLMAVQSMMMYSAVARIPVALALLVSNVYPLLLVLLTWALGGPAPTRRAVALMGLILCGLALALDVPGRLLASDTVVRPAYGLGIGLASGAAVLFAIALWLTEHKLRAMPGMQRGMLVLWVVLPMLALVAASGVLPGALAAPRDATGWAGLLALLLFYAVGFALFYGLMPRLDLLRNASVLNIEPVATLALAWLVLGQTLAPMQLLGGAVVLAGIALLAYRRG